MKTLAASFFYKGNFVAPRIYLCFLCASKNRWMLKNCFRLGALCQDGEDRNQSPNTKMSPYTSPTATSEKPLAFFILLLPGIDTRVEERLKLRVFITDWLCQHIPEDSQLLLLFER